MARRQRRPQAGHSALFLDLDGVLIVPGLYSLGRWMLRNFKSVEFAFLPSAHEQLSRIMTAVPNARLVISSTWRRGDSRGGFELCEELFRRNRAEALWERRYPGEGWRTPLGSWNRLDQIRAWMGTFSHSAVAALDDELEIKSLPFGVLIEPDQGIREPDADRAIQLLSGIKRTRPMGDE